MNAVPKGPYRNVTWFSHVLVHESLLVVASRLGREAQGPFFHDPFKAVVGINFSFFEDGESLVPQVSRVTFKQGREGTAEGSEKGGAWGTERKDQRGPEQDPKVKRAGTEAY